MNFTIEGRGLTRLIRGLVLEGRHQHALRILDDIEGPTLEQNYAFLRGELNFIGSSDSEEDPLRFGPEDDDSREYQATLREQWVRLVAPFGLAQGLWEIYAVLSLGWDATDAAWASKQVGGVGWGDKVNERWFDARSMFYADDSQEDRVFHVDRTCYLARKAGDIPAWVPMEWIAQSVGDAAERVRSQGMMEDRGACHDRYEEENFIADLPPKKEMEILRKKEVWVDTQDAWNEKHFQEIERYRKEITEQADKNPLGWFTLAVPREEGDERPTSYRVPLAPFRRWVLRKPFQEPLPVGDPRCPWVNICRPGMKMFFDSPDHSDWMIGAGIPLDAMYGMDRDTALSVAVGEANLFEYKLEQGDAQMKPLVHGDGQYTGRVVHPQPDEVCPPGSVVVIPRADADYYIPAHSGTRNRGVVISEMGGSMSHLAMVGLEDGIPTVLFPRALQLLPVGSLVRVNFETDEVTLLEG